MEEPAFGAQPFTFAGVAAFGHGSLGRFRLVESLIAVLASVAVVTFFELAWVPVINRTIASLPNSGAIHDGRLNWPQDTPLSGANSSFLWINVDPAGALHPGEGADLQLTFGRTDLRVRSLFGYMTVAYPRGYTIALNRTDLEPWWGAWHLPVAAILGLLTFTILFLAWTALGLVYAWPIRLISFYADRDLSWHGAWRFGTACLFPGALFLSAATLAYAFQRLNLVQLLAAVALHFMIGWVYVLFAPFCLSRATPRQKGNPFGGTKPKRKNPFANSS